MPQNTKVSGNSYSNGGHTWTYDQATYHSYYSTYGGMYPTYGTLNYYTVYNSPWFALNYTTMGNPWYGHAYPSGYQLQDGELVPVSLVQSTSPFWIAFWVILGITAVVLIIVFVRKRTPNTPRSTGSGWGKSI